VDLPANKTGSITEKYIQLTFNSYISDDFFSKVYAHYRHKLFFSGDFQGQEGVHIMHQCTLCNDNNGINQTSRLDIKIDKYILLLLFFLFQSLKACVNRVWQSNYTLRIYDTFIHTYIESYRQHYWFYARLDIVTLLFLVYFFHQLCWSSTIHHLQIDHCHT
jgi:hypothetical protein